MYNKNKIISSLICLCFLTSLAQAKVSPGEVSKLGRSLTPMGAKKEGNSSGSIPPWTGSMLGIPVGFDYKGSGSVYPNPYGDEKPIFTITGKNYTQYKANLSEGQIELFKRYPDSFKMPVYQSHREARYNETIEERTKWNATNTVLVNGVDGMRNYTGAIPFPMPRSGAEAIWNGRSAHFYGTMDALLDDVAVYPNNTKSLRRQRQFADYPYAQNNKLGVTETKLGQNLATIHITVDIPSREKGKMTIVHEAMDQVRHSRNSWVYLPGSRRVRRAPTVGYDTPDGPGGLVTIDDTMGFNGAMDRYKWKLLGKKEIYIPYHNYKFDTPKVKYNKLLPPYHANPDYMRYELHRVWVVEAILRPGARHIYAKRRFYMDEDSWHISLLESYDGRGDIWRVAILNTIYDYYLKAFIPRAQIFHDVQSGAYVAIRLVNETRPTNYSVKPKGSKYYTPQNLRKMGTR